MNNTVIRLLNYEHGAKVVEWFKAQGVDTRDFVGIDIGYYYGVINGVFIAVPKFKIPSHVKIIELPTEKTFPRVMYVSDFDDITHNSGRRVVLMQKNGKYIAWSNAETIEEAESINETTTWEFAKDIDEVEKPFEISYSEATKLLEEKFGKKVKITYHEVQD